MRLSLHKYTMTRFSRINFELAVKFMRILKYIVLENFPLYSILDTLSLNTLPLNSQLDYYTVNSNLCMGCACPATQWDTSGIVVQYWAMSSKFKTSFGELLMICEICFHCHTLPLNGSSWSQIPESSILLVQCQTELLAETLCKTEMAS